MDALLPYLTQMLALLPYLVIPVVGLVLCRKKLARSHPKASARATVGWVLLIVYLSLGRGASLIITMHAAQSGDRFADRMAYTNWLGYIGLASQLVMLASMLFLLLAILADRSGPESR
jgi:hypothetical protein